MKNAFTLVELMIVIAIVAIIAAIAIPNILELRKKGKVPYEIEQRVYIISDERMGVVLERDYKGVVFFYKVRVRNNVGGYSEATFYHDELSPVVEKKEENLKPESLSEKIKE